MPLNLELSSSSKINWTEKSKNIKEILLELNLLSDSAIFIDDSELECLEVETKQMDVLQFHIINPQLS